MALASPSDVKVDVRCSSSPGNSTEYSTDASQQESESCLHQRSGRWLGADE